MAEPQEDHLSRSVHLLLKGHPDGKASQGIPRWIFNEPPKWSDFW